MNQIRGKRIIISGLISSKVSLDEYLAPIRKEIENFNGQIVGELIQRRGISRSKKPGGSNKLDLPLSSRTYISSGKIEELKKLSNSVNADLVIFINNLTVNQIENIENLIELRVKTSNTISK
jgi:hypothetical protein